MMYREFLIEKILKWDLDRLYTRESLQRKTTHALETIYTELL